MLAVLGFIAGAYLTMGAVVAAFVVVSNRRGMDKKDWLWAPVGFAAITSIWPFVLYKIMEEFYRD